jgi:hypothetical protein
MIAGVVYLGVSVRNIYRLFVVVCTVLAVDYCARADDQIRSYTVPKEHPAAAAVPMQMAQGASDIPVNTAPVQWTLPDGWQQLAPDGIRIGNFAVPGKAGGKAVVAITSFPGEVGTELDNVNRWRGQLGLAPVEQSELSSEPVTVNSTDGKLFDLSGATARTIVALVRRNGATWFFKMTGDLSTVTDAKPAFMKFLKSVRFAGATDAAGIEAATPMPAPTAPSTAGDNSSPKWSVPSTWVEKAPGPMLFKSFSIADGGAVTVSFFPGAVGGTLANVNRWRGQMGLSPVEEGNLAGVAETLETAGGKATLADFEGTGAKAGQRLVAAIVPHGDNTWFYKLLGSEALVAKEKDSFVNFVKTVQYP